MIERFVNYLHQYRAARQLRQVTPEIARVTEKMNADELVNFMFSEEWARFFWIKQEYTEIQQLCRILEKHRPKVVLEIGTAQGGSLFLYTKLAAPDAIVISIDLPKGNFGGGYDANKGDFYKSFATGKQTMHLLREDSHAEATRQKVLSILGDKKVDFLFIDGDHTYTGVKADFSLYSPLVSSYGMIGFHDIVASTDGCEVLPFWTETKASYKTCLEFINDPRQSFCGIGLISPKDRIE